VAECSLRALLLKRAAWLLVNLRICLSLLSLLLFHRVYAHEAELEEGVLHVTIMLTFNTLSQRLKLTHVALNLLQRLLDTIFYLLRILNRDSYLHRGL
jgi:hypothetical protein